MREKLIKEGKVQSWGQFLYLIVMMLIALFGAQLLLRFGQGTLSDDMDRWVAEGEATVAEIAALVESVRAKLP
jgi:hypothetical protein